MYENKFLSETFQFLRTRTKAKNEERSFIVIDYIQKVKNH
jgi:hypothetical protein